MKVIRIACILTSSAFSQDNLGIDMAKMAEMLRLEGAELRVEDVTKREADARKLPLRSAWIVSAPGHELFFPLMVYTAPKGILHSEKHEALRKAIRAKPPKEGDFGYNLGFFEVSGIGECFVFMEEILISSNNPPRVEKGIPLPAWRPTRKSILSIIGTLESENLDFQIAVLLLDEDEIEGFPKFKSMLYGPDFALPKELASGVVKVIRDSNILVAAEARPEKKSKGWHPRERRQGRSRNAHIVEQYGREGEIGCEFREHWPTPLGLAPCRGNVACCADFSADGLAPDAEWQPLNPLLQTFHQAQSCEWRRRA